MSSKLTDFQIGRASNVQASGFSLTNVRI